MPPPQQQPTTNTLPSLPSPPAYLLPAALLTLALSILATTLAYRLTFPRRAAAELDRDNRRPAAADDDGEEEAPRRTRIQRIWAERRGERARLRGVEGETLLPRTPGRWGDGGGGGSGSGARVEGWGGGMVVGRRRRGGYVRVPGEEGEEGGDGVEVDDGKGWAREESGWLRKVDEGLDWCIEKVAGYLGDEGGEEGLVFPVTEEERGERVG
ncbi:arca-like protein [Neofusicoccum parvum]|nr:arca-like protein [Neofusicoccum parvum]